MPLPAFLAPVVGFAFREVVIKFLVLTAIFVVVADLMPFVLGKVLPFANVTSLNALFSQIPPGVWYFIDFFRIDVGLPLLISAWVARFLIRRTPVIG